MSVLFLFLSLFIGINFRYSIICSVIELTLIVVFLIYKKNKKIIGLSFLFVFLGLGLSFIRPSFNKATYQGMVVEVKDNYFIFSSSLEKFYVYEPNNYREVGDYLNITADKEELDFVTLESEFDFKEYLNNKGVYSQLIVKKIEVKFSNPIKIHKLRRNFLEKFDENSASVISSILFATSKDGELVDLSRELHLMRLISSSGI